VTVHGAARLTIAMFAGGVATFANLYAIQAVLPGLSRDLSLTESQASLAISVATGALAVTVLPWAAVADRLGRARTMVVAVGIAAASGLVVPLAPNLATLLVARGLSGAALAAVPALAMAHLVALAKPGRATAAGGIYVAGTSLGGLSGRLISGTAAGIIGGDDGWRWGLAATGVAVVGLAVLFAIMLPRERAVPATDDVGDRSRLHTALANPAAVTLYVAGFLLMGAFVTIYNLLSYRLLAPPYRVPASVVSLLFLTYLVGTMGSSSVGRLTDRWGRRVVVKGGDAVMAVGLVVLAARPLPLVFAGLVLATFGFFVAHAVAAGWVGILVPTARSQATATYSLLYYLGSAIVGYIGAVVYTATSWTGVTALVTACAAAAALAVWWWTPRGVTPATRPHPQVGRRHP
jgi:predicted MFS family arabinose efflux permease